MAQGDIKKPMQAMLSDTVEINTKKSPTSSTKSRTGNCANVLARAMLHDATYDGVNDRLETYRSSGSGFNVGDASNFVQMIQGICMANNLINDKNELDLDGLANAVEALVSNFLDSQTTAKKTTPDSNNPFSGLTATDTATTTVEQVEDEEYWEEYDNDEPITGLSPENIKQLTNEIITAHHNGEIHPVVGMVKQRLLAQSQTTVTNDRGQSSVTVKLFLNGKNRDVSVYKLENGTAKMQDSDEYFLFTSASTVGMNLLGLYSKRGGRFNVVWGDTIIADGADKFSLGAFGVAVMHLAEPHMIDKNGNQLDFTHDLRKYVDTSLTDEVKDVFIDVALANSPAMNGKDEVAKDWNLPEYSPYDRASKPKKAKTLL